MNNLKIKVEHCLSMFPETRDSDIELTIRVWKEYYPTKIDTLVLTLSETCDIVRLKDLFDLPREDCIKRYRAHFQNDLGLYPPSLEVAIHRGINEERWHKMMGEATTHKRM